MQPSAFDDAASTALDAIYSQQGVPATYTQSGETPITVTVLVEDRSRNVQDKQGSRSKIHLLRGSVRISEVEALDRGDTIQLTGETTVFKIVPASVSNDGLEWTFDATADVVTTVGNVQTFPNQ
tara:strand:+ start:2294 stop:2665 length:372 start_codon:yes stop_codon:yes gene_type:complete